MEEITTNDIRVYLYKVQKERQLSNATLDSRRTIIHSFLEWAANEQYIGSNPCRSIRPIKYERPKRNPHDRLKKAAIEKRVRQLGEMSGRGIRRKHEK